MLEYDTTSRLLLAREHVERLGHELRRANGPTRDEVGYPGWARLGSALTGRVERLRRRRGHGVPAFQG
jgi:hypothetical protein